MDRWRVTALNTGVPENLFLGGKELVTGIRKRPVTQPTQLTREGFLGDDVADKKHHGGPDKAICVYSGAHYGAWERELGCTLPPAAFGENLTVAALDEEALCIGDTLRLGEARVQVSQPRQPCRVLALRLERPDLIELVIQSGRCGFYLRVLTEGRVQPTDELRLMEQDPRGVTVARAHRVRHLREDGRAGLDEVLAVPALSASWRTTLQKMRDRAMASP